MASIYDAAKYVLEKLGKTEAIKLQKLLYYCQAWCLVWDDAPLFPEDFEAWATGPVCRPLREKFEDRVFLTADEIRDGDSSRLSEMQKDNVDLVLKYYGRRDELELIWQIQSEPPWQEARSGYEPGKMCREIIAKDSMAMYYSGLG